MGVLPATLFLLSVWHVWWTRPRLYLPSSSLITMCIIPLSLSAHLHTQFNFSLLLQPFCLKHTHVSLWSVSCFCFQRKKNSICSLKGEWLIFPGFSFLPIYFSRVTLQLPSLSVFQSLLSSPDFSSLAPSFHLFSLFQLPSLLVCVAKIQPWGYIASFMWGPVVTLKAHYVICRFASAQLSPSALRRILVCTRRATRSLPGSKCWWVDNNIPLPVGWNCAHVCALVDFVKLSHPSAMRQIDVKALSVVEARLMTVESVTLPLLLFYDTLTQLLQPLQHVCFFKCFKWYIQHYLADKTDQVDDLQDQTTRPNRA